MAEIGHGVLGLCTLYGWVWSSLAIALAGPVRPLWRYILLGLFWLVLPVSLLTIPSAWLGWLTVWLVLAVVYLWWLNLQPSNDRDWWPEVSRLAFAEVEGSRLRLHNVRYFQYRAVTDFDPHWESREYNLEQVISLDIFLSYWKSPHIAHVIMSWGFADGQYLAISIETRKARGQAYSELKGFFKQYTLTYIAADERDLVRLRTNYRKERVYFYRICNIPEHYRRELLRIYLEELNVLSQRPKFYHALFKNCTSGISGHFRTISPGSSLPDWRLIANGHLDELLYELGLLRQDLPFEQLREKSRIDLRMQALPEEGFSERLREGLV